MELDAKCRPNRESLVLTGCSGSQPLRTGRQLKCVAVPVKNGCCVDPCATENTLRTSLSERDWCPPNFRVALEHARTQGLGQNLGPRQIARMGLSARMHLSSKRISSSIQG